MYFFFACNLHAEKGGGSSSCPRQGGGTPLAEGVVALHGRERDRLHVGLGLRGGELDLELRLGGSHGGLVLQHGHLHLEAGDGLHGLFRLGLHALARCVGVRMG